MQRSTVGSVRSYGGFSFRIMKGLYGHYGSSFPVSPSVTTIKSTEYTELVAADVGDFVVTNLRLLFKGERSRGLSIPLKKIMAISIDSDERALMIIPENGRPSILKLRISDTVVLNGVKVPFTLTPEHVINIIKSGNQTKEEEVVDGEIGYFDLSDWWFSTFAESEQKYIESVYHPMGIEEKNPLTHGKASSTSKSAAMFLSGLATWFGKPEDRQLAHRILAKAEEIAKKKADYTDLHFVYQEMIRVYYKDRGTDPSALDAAISACEKQVAISRKVAEEMAKEYPNAPLPDHLGFKQLAIIREKQGNYSEAIRLSKVAVEEGWGEGWERRIARCEKKLHKSPKEE